MNIKMRTSGDVLYVHITGELDHHVAAPIREEIDKELNANEKLTNIEFDFSDLTFMDSSGIGVIMGRYKIVEKRGGGVYASHVRPQVQKLLSLSGLLNILTII